MLPMSQDVRDVNAKVLKTSLGYARSWTNEGLITRCIERFWKGTEFPGASSLLFRYHKTDFSTGVRLNANLLFPRSRRRKNRTLSALLRKHVISCFLPHHIPPFMPSNNLIFPRWHVRQFKFSALVSHGVIRMGHHKHFCVHPGMTTVASQADQPEARHFTGDGLINKRKRQVVGCCTLHMDGVQRGIGTFHLQI